jgi:hypothetical protein
MAMGYEHPGVRVSLVGLRAPVRTHTVHFVILGGATLRLQWVMMGALVLLRVGA